MMLKLGAWIVADESNHVRLFSTITLLRRVIFYGTGIVGLYELYELMHCNIKDVFGNIEYLLCMTFIPGNVSKGIVLYGMVRKGTLH
jgi:biotin transporter BioY